MIADLKGKTVIVTGASSGIGFETTKQFLAAGAHVVGASLEAGKLAELAGPEQLHVIETDLTDPTAANHIAKKALKSFGSIDVLFNNAGAAPGRESFASVTDAQWQKTFDLNIMGYVRMARAVLPAMLKQGRGSMVHCGSEAGVMPHPLLPDYNVSKAAIHMLSKMLSREYTPKGIRSNAVAPAHVRTELWDVPGGFLDSLAAKYDIPPEDREATVAAFIKDSRLPAGRLGRPEDVARAVVFLASDASDYISGVCLGIDGGVVPTV